MHHEAETRFLLDRHKFLCNFRCAGPGPAGGPSGMTAELLRLLLQSLRDPVFSQLRSSPWCFLAESPTSFQEPSGGVRGIVVGDFLSAGRSNGCSTDQPRGGERQSCIPVRVQSGRGMRRPRHSNPHRCGRHSNCVVRRRSRGVRPLRGDRGRRLFSVSQSNNSDSTYTLEDYLGVIPDIAHGESGEQGDARHVRSCATQSSEGCVGASFTTRPVARFLARHPRRLQAAACGRHPQHSEGTVAPRQNPDSSGRTPSLGSRRSRTNADRCPRAGFATGGPRRSGVERGRERPDQGVVILDNPLGHVDVVKDHLQSKIASHRNLLERIPAVGDLQAAWLLLLFGASARANFLFLAPGPRRTT